MTPPTPPPRRCLRCRRELTWLSDGSLVHAGWAAPQSDLAICLEGQLKDARADIEGLTRELRLRDQMAQSDRDYFTVALTLLDEHNIPVTSTSLIEAAEVLKEDRAAIEARIQRLIGAGDRMAVYAHKDDAAEWREAKAAKP